MFSSPRFCGKYDNNQPPAPYSMPVSPTHPHLQPVSAEPVPDLKSGQNILQCPWHPPRQDVSAGRYHLEMLYCHRGCWHKHAPQSVPENRHTCSAWSRRSNLPLIYPDSGTPQPNSGKEFHYFSVQVPPAVSEYLLPPFFLHFPPLLYTRCSDNKHRLHGRFFSGKHCCVSQQTDLLSCFLQNSHGFQVSQNGRKNASYIPSLLHTFPVRFYRPLQWQDLTVSPCMFFRPTYIWHPDHALHVPDQELQPPNLRPAPDLQPHTRFPAGKDQFPVLPMPKTRLPFFSFVLSFSFVSYFTLIAVVFENAP